jgi:hypothetical protein
LIVDALTMAAGKITIRPDITMFHSDYAGVDVMPRNSCRPVVEGSSA